MKSSPLSHGSHDFGGFRSEKNSKNRLFLCVFFRHVFLYLGVIFCIKFHVLSEPKHVGDLEAATTGIVKLMMLKRNPPGRSLVRYHIFDSKKKSSQFCALPFLSSKRSFP